MARKMGKRLQAEVSSESGMVDIFILVVVSFLLIISSWFLGNVLLHYQVVDAHVEKFKEEYKIEGALVEAIQLLKDKGSAFRGDDIPSSYSSLFCFSVGEGKLIISKIEEQGKNMPPVAEVIFTWEEDELKVDRVETRYNFSYSR